MPKLTHIVITAAAALAFSMPALAAKYKEVSVSGGGSITGKVNIGGAKVSAEVLEEEIFSFSEVVDAGVAGIGHPAGFDFICAAVIGRSRRLAASWP